jgi:hypothetical protein
VSLGECPIPELDGELAFDGVLETPSGMIGVFSAHDEQLLGLRIGRERARVRIWTNDPTEPDRIHVVASPADGPPRGP